MARGIDDVVVAVVASPTSTVIGGAAQTVRDLVAAWEEREVMAREVAVDVASHTPQVDPILDDLYDALADITPLTPEVPYYSATLFDPRERPVCDADYWADNLRHTVRFSSAVQAALEDGHRVFAELSPHPLLTHAVEQNAKSQDISVAVLAGMRREQPLPHGVRSLVTDLHSAGAAVDFSVLFPSGNLVDAPLSAWNHVSLLLNPDATDGAHSANTVVVHPLLGSHVRLPEDPERHAWQGEVGTAALPWLGDHKVHNVGALPGAAYCEMALAAARKVLGDDAEVRDLRFEAMLLLDEETEGRGRCDSEVAGVVEFSVETNAEGARIRRASAAPHAGDGEEQPPAYDMEVLKVADNTALDGAEMRAHFVAQGIDYGPAFTGLARPTCRRICHQRVGGGGACLAQSCSQQVLYGIHPALLDACFQAVGAHTEVQVAGSGGLLLPLGVRRLRADAPTRNAHYCYITVTNAHASGIEADLDVLDEHGTVLVAVRGLQLGSGVPRAPTGIGC